MKNKLLVLLLLLMIFIPFTANADQYDADRHQMKLMLIDIQNKLNKRQFDPLMPYFDKHAVITFLDARTVVGKREIEAYIEKMMTGSNPILRSFTVEGSEDTPAMVYSNNTATAHGWIKNNFDFVIGGKKVMEGRWTATLIKEGNAWKIVALHFSTDAFNSSCVVKLGPLGVICH
jgi:hypothetical protein